MNAITLLLDSHRGVYIPRDFINGHDLEKLGLELSDWERTALADPENDGYWDAWEQVESRAKHTSDSGDVYTLHHDGDLWLICYERMSAEERENFGFDL